MKHVISHEPRSRDEWIELELAGFLILSAIWTGLGLLLPHKNYWGILLLLVFFIAMVMHQAALHNRRKKKFEAELRRKAPPS